MTNVRFICVALSICLAGYLALFLFGKSSTYCATTRQAADLSPCYKFALKGQDAQILLVGDSSLLYGIKPDIVTNQIHYSVYNYGIVGPVFAFEPERIIDHYLATNERPKFVIIYISPWDVIEPGHIRDPVWFPLGLQLLQHGSLQQFAALLRARPLSLVEAPQIIAHSIAVSRDRNIRLREQMEKARGHFDFSALLPERDRSLTDCRGSLAIGPPETSPTRREIQRLKGRYALQGLPVYVYVAPFANCGANTPAIQQAYRQIADNVPAALQDELFVQEHGSSANVHVNQQGADTASLLLAQFIQTHIIKR